MRTGLILLGLSFVLFVFLLPPAPRPAHAQSGTTINVNTFADELNNDGDCSLREAITAANTNTAVDACPAGSSAAMDEINLSSGVYYLSLAGTNENNAATGDLDLLDDVRLAGAGAGATIIHAGGLDRVIDILRNLDVELAGLTITGGYSDFGAGVYVDGPVNLHLTDVSIEQNRATLFGGGMYSVVATITLDNSRISDNMSDRSGGGIYGRDGDLVLNNSVMQGNDAREYGGAIYNESYFAWGTIRFNRSLLADNTAAEGGALYTAGLPTREVEVTIESSTLSGNLAAERGGALMGWRMELDIDNSTLSGNRASQGSGLWLSLGTASLHNTILANSLAGTNCQSSVTLSGGFNLSDDGSCAFAGANNMGNAEDGLLPLADNGGSTYTHALDNISAALDAGNCSTTTDQRGMPRPVDFASLPGAGNECDIGAYEAEKQEAAYAGRPQLVLSAPAGATATASLDISNLGSELSSLSVNLVSVSGGYSVSGLPITALDGGEPGVQVEVSCVPAQSDGTLTIQTNEPGNPQYNYDLTCEAAPDLPPAPSILEVTTGCSEVTVRYTAQGQQASHFYGIAVFREIPGQEDEIVAVGGTPALQDGELYDVTLQLSREYPAGTPLYVLVQASPANLLTPAAGCTP